MVPFNMPDDEDDVTIRRPDAEADDDATIRRPDAEADDDATIRRPDAEADDGATVSMPDVEADDGATFSVPGEEDDGATFSVTEDAAPAGIHEQPTEARPIQDTVISPKVGETAVSRLLQGRYRTERVLGSGGFGAAYIAMDVKLNRACVVKQMLIPADTSEEDIEDLQSNFQREAQLLVQLNHPGHPNIPEIYDFFSETAGNFLVMKYIEGKNLKDVMDETSERRIPWREAVRYAVDVCDALNYMHSTGKEPVMHRDIKPANILLGDDGRVWLVDFGLAKAKPVEGTGDLMATRAAGSLGYTPLEQWTGEATPTSDVYALGATLHHLVTGKHPMGQFRGELNMGILQDMHGNLTPIRKIDSSLPKGLENTIMSATSPDPKDRPTVIQLKSQLEALIKADKAAALFTFKSGEVAESNRDLVILCEKHRKEAETYLSNGDFERWFAVINRNDLVEAAQQARQKVKSDRDALEKFMKLLLPNLFLDRLLRASGHMIRMAIQLLLIVVIGVLALTIAGSYGLGWLLHRGISSYAWNFDSVSVEGPNTISEETLNEGVWMIASTFIRNPKADMIPPNMINLTGSWASIPLSINLELKEEDGKPHIYVLDVNGANLFLVGENISGGINRGIDDAFAKAPVDITKIEMGDTKTVYTAQASGRAPLPTPTPTITPTPEPTPTPVGISTLEVFNLLEEPIILEIEGTGQTWELDANGTAVIEIKPGTYDYTILYQSTRQVAAEGTKTWGVQIYKWRIGQQQ